MQKPPSGTIGSGNQFEGPAGVKWVDVIQHLKAYSRPMQGKKRFPQF